MAEVSTSKKLVAEFIGTGALTFAGAGSAAATFSIGKAAGVPFSMAQLGVISFAFMFVIVGLVYSLGHVSGCHINPAVTLALAATRKFPWRDVPGYLGAQALGGVAGAASIYATLGHAGSVAGLGITSYGADVSVPRAIFAELIGTFLLVLVIFGAIDGRAPGGWAGLAIGSVVFAVIIIVAPATGAAINPARYFGPMLIQQTIGGSVPWHQLPVYLIGQIVGGLAGGAIYLYLGSVKADTDAADAVGRSAESVVPGTATREPVQSVQPAEPVRPAHAAH
jgi:glycerol uptake facilitator protein